MGCGKGILSSLHIECSIILSTDLVQGQRFHTRCQEFQKIDIHKSQMQISSSKIGHVITQLLRFVSNIIDTNISALCHFILI